MARTSAHQKQADAIRQRMNEIRTELPYGVDAARDRVKQYSDWRFHFRRHPYAWMAAAAVAGFLIVPSRKRIEQFVVHAGTADRNSGPPEHATGNELQPPAKSVLGGLVGALATMALKQGTNFALHRIGSLIEQQSKERHHDASAELNPPNHRAPETIS